MTELRGSVVLLDFWSVKCLPCIAGMPAVEAMYKKYKDRGFEVVAIHPFGLNEQLHQFLEQHDYSFSFRIDVGSTTDTYAVSAYPTYFLIDRQGRLVWGPKHHKPPEDTIEKYLDAPDQRP